MRILQHSLCVLCISIIVNLAAGQQVYQSQDYGMAGTQQLYSRHLVGFTDAEIIAHGSDVTWDVSNLVASDLLLSEIVSRDEAVDGFTFTALCGLGGINVFACLNIWNSTEQAWLVQDTQTLIQVDVSDLKHFQHKTSTQLLENFLGFSIDFNGSPTAAVIVYPTPDTVLTFPMMYGDSLSSRITWGIDLAATGQNIQYSSRQLRTSKVDGWGALMTPYDTLNGVLRVRAVLAHNDTLTTDSLTIPVMFNQVEYTWYDTSYGIPVMIANGFVTDSSEFINSVTYLVDAQCPAPTWTVSSDAPVYFIDSTGSALAHFSVEMSNAGIYSWDFGDGFLESSDDGISHVYGNPGIYTVEVTGCMTNCLPLNSCTTQTLTIEVRDTTSSTYWPDPEAYGIQIFPNPAQAQIMLMIPENSGALEFQILDLHGKQLHQGYANPGLQHVDLTKIPAGLYLIRLRATDSGQVFRSERILIL